MLGRVSYLNDRIDLFGDNAALVIHESRSAWSDSGRAHAQHQVDVTVNDQLLPPKKRDLQGAIKMDDRCILWPVGELENAVDIKRKCTLRDTPSDARSFPTRHLDVDENGIAPRLRILGQEGFRQIVHGGKGVQF